MNIIPIYGSGLTSNTYLLVSGSSALVVDPSASVDEIIRRAEEVGATLTGILLTHGHFDHTLSLDKLRNRLGIKASIHRDDAIMLTDGKKNAYYDFFGRESSYAPADILLDNGDRIPLGDEEIEVIHTPGHSPGSVCYKCGNLLVSGDTIFADTYGRYDLWGGDVYKLADSLRKLRAFREDTVIYPGHGDTAILKDALDTISKRY